MQEDLDALREIERLLREAERRLGPATTFRLRTLLQMSLFELQRERSALEGRKDVEPATQGRHEPAGD